MHRMKKAAALVLALALMLAACSGGGAVAMVNGNDISQKEFDEEFAMHRKLYEWQYGEEFLKQESVPGRTMELELKNQVLNLMIMYRLVEADLAANDVTVTDEEVQEAVESAKAEMPAIEGEATEEGEEEASAYEVFKEQTGLTDAEFEAYNRQNLIYQKHMEMYNERHPVDEERVLEEYEANKNVYDTVTASHILVDSEEEAIAAKERVDGGEDFAEVAREVSTDSSAQSGGELGEFTYGRMIPEFSDAAFSLGIDEVSDPVQSQYGWHVIKVTDRTEGVDSVRAVIEQQLQSQEYTEYLRGLEETHDVQRIADYDSATESVPDEGTEPETTEPDATEAESTETETDTTE